MLADLQPPSVRHKGHEASCKRHNGQVSFRLCLRLVSMVLLLVDPVLQVQPSLVLMLKRSVTGSGTGLRSMLPDDLFVVRHIVVGSLHR